MDPLFGFDIERHSNVKSQIPSDFSEARQASQNQQKIIYIFLQTQKAAMQVFCNEIIEEQFSKLKQSPYSNLLQQPQLQSYNFCNTSNSYQPQLQRFIIPDESSCSFPLQLHKFDFQKQTDNKQNEFIGKVAGTVQAAVAVYMAGRIIYDWWTTPTQSIEKCKTPTSSICKWATPSSPDLQWINKAFINYIKRVESAKGPVLSLNSKDAQSPEGGEKTICWGHKLTAKEIHKAIYTIEECEDILLKDLMIAKQIARKRVGAEEFDRLDAKRQEMLIDFCFNLGGLNGFPKFVKALMANDYKTMAQQYLRYYKKPGDPIPHQVKDRNQQFYKEYLEPNLY